MIKRGEHVKDCMTIDAANDIAAGHVKDAIKSITAAYDQQLKETIQRATDLHETLKADAINQVRHQHKNSMLRRVSMGSVDSTAYPDDNKLLAIIDKKMGIK